MIGLVMLMAATGAGVSDIATARFAGSQLGTAIRWAAALALLLLNERKAGAGLAD